MATLNLRSWSGVSPGRPCPGWKVLTKSLRMRRFGRFWARAPGAAASAQPDQPVLFHVTSSGRTPPRGSRHPWQNRPYLGRTCVRGDQVYTLVVSLLLLS